MELRYPIVFIPVILAAVVAFLIVKKHSQHYKKGSKIANTKFTEKSDYYQKLMREYKYTKIALYSLFAVVFICVATLASRPSSMHTVADEIYNRDIMLCMDISGSVVNLNYELTKSLRKTVSSLHGERFGISIFNTTSILLAPPTDDYKFIDDVLAQVSESLRENGLFSNNNSLYNYEYITDGTIENYEERGSSLIGDGLASCVFDFPELEEDKNRTRIIIFSTDNQLEGTPLVELKRAAEIAKEKNILVYGIGTKSMENDDRQEMIEAINITGGRYYEHSNSTAESIIADIEATSKTVIRSHIQSRVIDMPQIPFVFLTVSFIGIVILGRRVVE